LVTVVGSVPNVAEGEWVEADGRWIILKKSVATSSRHLSAAIL